VQAESVKYTIRDTLLSPVLQTNSYNIPYDSDSIEVQNFAEVITDSLNLSHSYTATDIEFMKEHVIPTLLTARDVLLMKSKYSRRLGEGSSLPSKEFVISTKIVPDHESKSLTINTSSLEPTSFIRRRLGDGDVFSVKLKADGTFVFSIPTEPIPVGALKKVKLKIISSIEEPNHFREVAKASIRHDKRGDERKAASFDAEMNGLIHVLPPSAKPILHKRFVDSRSYGAARIVKAYFEPAVDALTEIERIQRKSSFTFEEAAAIIQEQYNFIEDLITQVNELHTIKGVVHHDIKTENLLILRPKTPGERRTLQLNDFEFCRRIGTVVDGRRLGTPGYYIEGLPGDIEKDKFAIGRIIAQILSVMNTIIDKIDTTDTRRLFFIKQLTNQFIEQSTTIRRQLTNIYTDRLGRPYYYGNTNVYLNDETRPSILHRIKAAGKSTLGNFSKYLTMTNEALCSEYISTLLFQERRMHPKNALEFELCKNRLKELLDEITDLPDLTKRALYTEILTKLSTNYEIHQATIATLSYLDREHDEVPNSDEELEIFLNLADSYIEEHFSALDEHSKRVIHHNVDQILRSRLY